MQNEGTPQARAKPVARRHSAQFKAQILEECAQPGAFVIEVSKRHAVHPNLICKWRAAARANATKADKDNKGDNTSATPKTPPSFSRLAITAPAAPPQPTQTAPQNLGQSTIHLELQRNGTHVRIDWPGTGISNLAQCLRELLQ